MQMVGDGWLGEPEMVNDLGHGLRGFFSQSLNHFGPSRVRDDFHTFAATGKFKHN